MVFAVKPVTVAVKVVPDTCTAEAAKVVHAAAPCFLYSTTGVFPLCTEPEMVARFTIAKALAEAVLLTVW